MHKIFLFPRLLDKSFVTKALWMGGLLGFLFLSDFFLLLWMTSWIGFFLSVGSLCMIQAVAIAVVSQRIDRIFKAIHLAYRYNQSPLTLFPSLLGILFGAFCVVIPGILTTFLGLLFSSNLPLRKYLGDKLSQALFLDWKVAHEYTTSWLN